MSALNPPVVVRRDRHKAVSGGEQPKTLCLSLGERHLLEESVGIENRSIPKQVVFRGCSGRHYPKTDIRLITRHSPPCHELRPSCLTVKGEI